MGYRYLDHEADVGILAEGRTIEEAFTEGATAMFGVMVKLEGVKPKKKTLITCEGDSLPSLYISWLNELLSMADMKGMFFCEFKIDKLQEKDSKYHLEGSAKGETIDNKKMAVRTEVKAATYYGLKYEQKNGMHIFQCVVDV